MVGGGKELEAQAKSCSVAAWGTPKELRPATAPSAWSPRFPSLTAAGRDAYIAASNVRDVTTNSLERADPVILEVGSGKLLPAPRGPFRFAYPKLVRPQSGGLLVVWAEPTSSVRTPSWQEMDVRTVWSAQLGARGAWSEPKSILSGRILWDNELNDAIVAGGPAETVAVPMLPGMAVMMHEAGIWRSVRLEAPMLGSASILSQPDGWVAAHAGGAMGSPDVGGVYVYRGGWSAAAPISQVTFRASGEPAMNVRLRAAIDGTLHVVWLQSRPDGGADVRHAWIKAGRGEWEVDDGFRVPAGWRALDAAIDSCGQMHVVVDVRAERSASLAHAIWNGSWSPLRHHFGDYQPLEFSLRALWGDRVGLAFVQQPAGGSSKLMFVEWK
jgi:hypothetical protein